MKLTQKAVELVMEDFMAKQKELEEKQNASISFQEKMKRQLAEERKLRESAEWKAMALQEKLDYAFRDQTAEGE